MNMWGEDIYQRSHTHILHNLQGTECSQTLKMAISISQYLLHLVCSQVIFKYQKNSSDRMYSKDVC